MPHCKLWYTLQAIKTRASTRNRILTSDLTYFQSLSMYKL